MPWSVPPTTGDDWDSPDPPHIEVCQSENQVVAELLGPDGEVIRQWLEREPIGFRLR